MERAHVALLRGVNVGGHGMVSMKDVKAAFERAGLAGVRTYINSGNILFGPERRGLRELEVELEAALGADCGVSSKVIVKSFSEYERIVRALPKQWTEEGEWRYNVLFLRHTVDSKKILEEIRPKEEIEELVYCRGALLWRVLRSAVTRSAVARVNRTPLYQELTVRNLNTTKKLYDLMRRQ